MKINTNMNINQFYLNSYNNPKRSRDVSLIIADILKNVNDYKNSLDSDLSPEQRKGYIKSFLFTELDSFVIQSKIKNFNITESVGLLNINAIFSIDEKVSGSKFVVRI